MAVFLLKNENQKFFNLDQGAYIVTGTWFLRICSLQSGAAFGGLPIAIDLSLQNYDSLKEEIKNDYGAELFAYETVLLQESC